MELEEERARFAELKQGLVERFKRFRADPTRPYTAVIVPSQSVDPEELEKIEGVAHYEERSLFNLMLLRRPRLNVIYVTSKRLNPLVVDYYLHQLRGVPSSHARARLKLFDCDDASARPLTQKILERPRLIERIKAAIDDVDNAHMVVFNSSPLERQLAVELGIPLNAADPDLVHYGSKTGSRRLFREAGVPLAPGFDDLKNEDDVAESLYALKKDDPDLRRAVVKLNDSFSGEGNAVLELEGISSKADALQKLPELKFEAAGLQWEKYRSQFRAMGGVVEAWLEGEDKASPSVQLRINPLGEVQTVSTHDQVLGGPSGQVFIGATFPAAPAYRVEIGKMARAVGEKLSAAGVIGRSAVDFLVVGGKPYAVEINLRQGGTTHPFNTLKFLTDGDYDEETGEFRTAQGQSRCYFATDALKSDAYKGILPFDLLDALVVQGIHFRANETGVVFHLLGCLSEFGKLGCTAIAPTVEEARARYERVVQILDGMGG
jgi:hypothetical protein